ncbi:hypothetical protein NBRC116596_30660 [Litorivita sp. NS0012-18]
MAAALLALAGCGDPIDKMPRLSQVPLAEDAPQAEAMAAPAELAPQEADEGLFARLLRKKAPAAVPTAPEVSAPAQDLPPPDAQSDPVAEAQSDPLAQAQSAAMAETQSAPPPEEAAPARRGIFAALGLGRKAPEAQPEPPVAAALAAPDPAAQAAPQPAAPDTAAATPAPALAPALASTPPESAKPARKGLAALFKRNRNTGAGGQEAPLTLAAVPPALAAAPQADTPSGKASAAPSAEALGDTPAAAPRKGGGFFGKLAAAKSAAPRRANGPDALAVAYGTQLPYGEIAHICNLPTSAMGKEVASYPERRAKYRLYDSLPGHTTAHTFYMTGFADGCARQFTAALAVFGSASMYERLQYLLPAKQRQKGAADQAYEKVKSKVCGAPRGKPCGNKIGMLERDTVFVSVYERYGDNARWTNLLLHDGAVLAKDIKAP